MALGAIHGGSSFAFTYANHLSNSDTINSLIYLAPALALGWLWAFTEVTVADPKLFIAGAVGVIAINMVIHLDPEGAGDGQGDYDGPVSGYGFKALVIALWASGSLVVLRDDWLPEGMLQWGAGEYWGILALSATVFVFILSFRQQRLDNREHESDRLALQCLADIDTLRYDSVITDADAEELRMHLQNVDSGRETRGIGTGYINFRNELMTNAGSDEADHRRAKRNLLLDVEVLTNLRQQGREVTEAAVIVLFAATVVVVSLVFRPAGADGPLARWEGFAIEMVCMCIAAAVVFLAFDMYDRRRLRDSPRLHKITDDDHLKRAEPDGWRLNLHSLGSVGGAAQRNAALTLGVVVFAAFVLLLRHKWLGA